MLLDGAFDGKSDGRSEGMSLGILLSPEASSSNEASATDSDDTLVESSSTLDDFDAPSAFLLFPPLPLGDFDTPSALPLSPSLSLGDFDASALLLFPSVPLVFMLIFIPVFPSPPPADVLGLLSFFGLLSPFFAVLLVFLEFPISFRLDFLGDFDAPEDLSSFV